MQAPRSYRVIAIVGRPNVGKSAIFNRLAGRRISIVHDEPGVTRDRITATCKMTASPFTVIDTGGIGSNPDDSFSNAIKQEADMYAFHFEKEKIVFTGDTLFSLGCGRVFEGTHEQMFNSINKLKNLNPETSLYCGHEYTKKNLEFCLKYDPNNDLLKKKSIAINSKLNNNLPTVPTTIDEETKMNVFLRCGVASIKQVLNLKDSSDEEIFSKLRDSRNY